MVVRQTLQEELVELKAMRELAVNLIHAVQELKQWGISFQRKIV